MRMVRLKKNDLKLDLEAFLVRVGAVREKQGFPQHVYLSTEDSAVLRRNARRSLRKQYPRVSKRQIDYGIGSSWLMFGPNELLNRAVRPGYALVNVTAIDESYQRTLEAREQEAAAAVAEAMAKQKPTIISRMKDFFRKSFKAMSEMDSDAL